MKDFESIVARAGRLREQAKALEEEAKELLDSLGPLGVDDYPAGDFILRVMPNRRFDAATAKRALPEDKFASILKPVPDSALAKALLDADDYRLCQKEYEPKRSIVRVDDL